MSAAQIAALVIFIGMFILIVTEKIERHIVSLVCALLTLVLVFGVFMHSGEAILNSLAIKSFIEPSFWYSAAESSENSSGINWATIIFIAGMMIMVEGMGKAGFFRWLCLRLAKAVEYKVVPLFLAFMIMSAILAMFIDSITVILFLAAATIELAKLLKFNPVPLILSEIFCANLGGSATMCGDPPNIIIGTSLGYSFADFLTNTGLMALVSLVFVIIYFYFCFKNKLVSKADSSTVYPDPKDAITDVKAFTISAVIFFVAVVLLVTHAQTGLTVATIGLFIGVVTLLTSGKDAMVLLKKVDYDTLLFFIGLFVVVSGLEETGILEIIAGFIADISGDNAKMTVAIVMWVSAIASAFVDNIPFAATMIPVIRVLAETTGCSLPVLSWGLAVGTDIGGSATPIGASANVVGISVAAREGHTIGWIRYCSYMAPATIIVILISMVCIFVRYF
ncbi:MAG: citrate transporter [Lachnospiraceae bacterium]|nr:citrate transporter [Lachnospiraceae bacterium]